jgi:hypothetical protein
MAIASSAIGIVLTTSTSKADTISGGPCIKNNLESLNGTTGDGKVPDGHGRFIDCGPGNDFAVVNVSGHLILAHRCCSE